MRGAMACTQDGFLLRLLAMLILLQSACGMGWAALPGAVSVPVPVTLRAAKFQVSVNGRPAYFMNAAANYYDLNLLLQKPLDITITAPSADYWAKGVEVQPWRENIRPLRNGAAISFHLDHPAKLAISRPGDHLGGAEMLFVFANAVEANAPVATARGVRYFGPGIHVGGIDARSGDRIYLAAGAVILGGLNVWDVHDVKVWGLGTILYDGPQNPNDDEGWKNQKNWHAIVMHNARDIEIRGITCIVRSRTWMIQMRDSRFVTFDNVKVIGGSPSNANQDGMDWLGGGETTVRNSFIRAADDIFAMQGNWDGYDAALMRVPGHDVTNILIENSVLSTSISNVVRAGWPTKTFNTNNFTMRNSDVIEMGIGGCGIPFALLEVWGTPDAHGNHGKYLFDDIRLEDWYSLVQLQQRAPALRDITFRNIWAIDQAASSGSTLLGDVSGVRFEGIRLGKQNAATADELDVTATGGAATPAVTDGTTVPHVSFVTERSGDGKTFTFKAQGAASYEWFFGDGTRGTGESVTHAYADEEGTVWDGSGRYRVMLHGVAGTGSAWTSDSVIVKTELQAAQAVMMTAPGLRYSAVQGDLAAVESASSESAGVALELDSVHRPRADHYALAFEGFVDAPSDGGYRFTELSRDGSRLTIDGHVVLKNATAWPQVCGSVGNAVQQVSGTVGLMKGKHKVKVEMSQSAGEDAFALLWQGPGIALQRVPGSALSH